MLDLTQSKELDEKDKATFASCVGLVIYLSQDRCEVCCKRISKTNQSTKNVIGSLKILARYLQGTKSLGHMTKIAEDVDIQYVPPLHAFCDSDWAGDKESRKSTSGEIIFLAGTAGMRNQEHQLQAQVKQN